jgi:uncharacterized protein
MNATTQLYKSEGRENLRATLRNVAKASNTFDVGTIAIFAASADSVLKLRDLVDDSREIVAVTFPAGYTALVNDELRYIGIPVSEDRKRLKDASVTVVQGVLPFNALGVPESSDVKMLVRALDLFGGGLQLCVQAILMACDAGAIKRGQRCIAMSADTAIVAHSEDAFRFLSDQSRFAIEHIICKPVAYSITRPAVVDLSVTREKTAVPQEKPAALHAGHEPGS